MRRKPSSQNNGGYNNQRRQRYQGGGQSQQGGHHHSNQGRGQRKNYAAAREKYLGQARDAIASGDRVLGEYYYQHADHCYRMMVEEGYFTRNQQQQQAAAPQVADGNAQMAAEENGHPENISQLPSFITGGFDQPAQAAAAPAQNWEERDA